MVGSSFIKLPLKVEGDRTIEVLINLDHIISITPYRPHRGFSILEYLDGQQCIVKKSISEIFGGEVDHRKMTFDEWWEQVEEDNFIPSSYKDLFYNCWVNSTHNLKENV